MQNYESDNTEIFPQLPVQKEIPKAEKLPISPDNPPWNGWTAFSVWVASVIFIYIFPNLFLLPYLANQQLDFSNQREVLEFAKTDSTAVLILLIAVVPAHICTFILAWLVVTRFRKFSFRETLGWNLNSFKIWHSLAIFAVFYAIAFLLVKVFGVVETDFDRMLKSSRTAVYFVAFFATFTAPLVEEVVYRGLLYSAFQRRFGIVLAVLLVTVLFTAVHIPQYSNENIPNYASIITVLLLSLTLTLIRVQTKNLLPCILLHTVINGVQSVILIFQPYIENYIETYHPKVEAFLHLFK